MTSDHIKAPEQGPVTVAAVVGSVQLRPARRASEMPGVDAMELHRLEVPRTSNPLDVGSNTNSRCSHGRWCGLEGFTGPQCGAEDHLTKELAIR
jgi:hypothetical protein